MPTTAELAELTQHSQETNRRMEQMHADLVERGRPAMRPYTVEGSLLAASDLPTQYNLPAIPVTPLPLPVFDEPEPAALVVQRPFTLPVRTLTVPIATEEPSPLVAVIAPVSSALFKYKHLNIRSSPGEQIEAAIKSYKAIPERIYISSYCRLILDMMSWGESYFYEDKGGYKIALLAGNWLADDEVSLEGGQGPLPQPKTAPEPSQLPAWLEGIGKEEEACGGIGGDGGDQGELLQAS
jgi:hypothetical protein